MATKSFLPQDFEALLKYPRTPHLEGSRLQPGDEGYEQIPFSTLKGQHLVVEEKFDGANSGVSFSGAGELLLQSRGHYLTGGGRERQFNLFKRWAQAHEGQLLERLEDRFVMYGEWMHKLHSVPYDALPHYFLEFDIWDRRDEKFLSTQKRRELLAGLPVLSVAVLYDGATPSKLKELMGMVRPSLGKSKDWKAQFIANAVKAGVAEELAWSMADKSDCSEGLYLKIETENEVTGRLKWVRPDFVQTILAGGKHHSEQPYVPNSLTADADIFAPALTATWSLS